MTTYGFYKNEEGKGFCMEERNCVNGAGKYESVAFVVTTLYSVKGVELRKEGTNAVRYAIVMDGEVFNKYRTLDEAEEMFIDVAGISKKKLAKIKALATA